jgi:sulfur-oxidizing protein SoxY
MTTTRRQMLCLAGAVTVLPTPVVHASPDSARQALQSILGNAKAQTGRVTIDLPPLVENGNAVVVQVSVSSPMTAQDHVKAIHLVAEGNPLPNIMTAYFYPENGRAAFTSRIRLAESQRVWAIAQMSDGSYWQGHADTLVTLSACTEER